VLDNSLLHDDSLMLHSMNVVDSATSFLGSIDVDLVVFFSNFLGSESIVMVPHLMVCLNIPHPNYRSSLLVQ
jgi:hypothetical protein